jgi:hypothetical protein
MLIKFACISPVFIFLKKSLVLQPNFRGTMLSRLKSRYDSILVKKKTPNLEFLVEVSMISSLDA